jgi:hypothetical protein
LADLLRMAQDVSYNESFRKKPGFWALMPNS